jgi:hypothetical protein
MGRRAGGCLLLVWGEKLIYLLIVSFYMLKLSTLRQVSSLKHTNEKLLRQISSLKTRLKTAAAAAAVSSRPQARRVDLYMTDGQ